MLSVFASANDNGVGWRDLRAGVGWTGNRRNDGNKQLLAILT